MAETCLPEVRCVFVETNLDTRLGILVHNHETISGFKEKLSKDHQQCFPQVGEINISAVKIKRRKRFYHLPDVMVLGEAFAGISRLWYMYVDAAAARVDKVELPSIMENVSNHGLLEGKKEVANDTLLLDGYTKNQPLEEWFETEVAENTSKKRKLKNSDGEKSRKKPAVDLNQSAAAATTASRFDVGGSHELCGNLQVEVVAQESSLREKLDDILTGATGRKEVEMAEKSVEDVGTDKIEIDNLVSHPADHLDTNSGLTTTPHTEKKKRRKKRSKDDVNQSSSAANTTSRDIVNEINGVPANVDRVDATPESLPISRGNPFSEASQKENEMVENSVGDVGRDNIETDNLVSHKANQLDSNNLEKETKKRRKKSSKDDINQSSAAATTASRDIVNEINGVPGNVDHVDATPEPLPISRGEAKHTDNEIGEKSVRDNIETDNPSSHPTNHLDADSGLTTRPDTEKKKRRKKRSKNDIDQSVAAITTSRDIVNEINGVPANVDRVDATSESLPISRRGNLGNPFAEAKQKENKMDEKINDDAGNRKAIPCATDNMETNNAEIDADEAKSLKSTKKKKSKKAAKTPAEKDTLIASDARNVEPIGAVDGEGADNVIRNVLDSLQEKHESEENMDIAGKKSSKKSKKKHSLKVSESQVLSVEVNNAALEEARPMNNPKDTDALFTPAKKDTESDASLLKKSTEVGDNAEDNSLPKKLLTEKADMGDNFGSSQKDDIVANGKKQDQVAGEAKSEKEKKSLDLHPSGSIDGSLCSMKPKEKKGRDQPAGSGASHLQSMVKKNDRSGSMKVAANTKKIDVKESSKPFTVNMSQTSFFEDAENSTEDESKTSDVSTRTPSGSSSDDVSDVTSMSRKQGNNLAGGTTKFSGSLQDILRRSSSYKKALLRASQSQHDSSDDENPALDCVPDSQAV